MRIGERERKGKEIGEGRRQTKGIEGLTERQRENLATPNGESPAFILFSRVNATLEAAVSVDLSVGWSVGRTVEYVT